MLATNENQFDDAYWLSQPPEVRALRGTQPTQAQQAGGASGWYPMDNDLRRDRAIQLAIKGYKIDTQIMVWGWDPFKVQSLRLSFGYKWVPNALQPPVQAAPGLGGPGITPYDPNNPPGGAIKVSLDLDDYPPFDPPMKEAPAGVAIIPGSPIGMQTLGNLYYSVPGDPFLDGMKFTEVRGVFLKHVTVTPFGRSPYWEKLPAGTAS